MKKIMLVLAVAAIGSALFIPQAQAGQGKVHKVKVHKAHHAKHHSKHHKA